LITATIEGKLASLQETQRKIKSDSARPAIEQLVKGDEAGGNTVHHRGTSCPSQAGRSSRQDLHTRRVTRGRFTMFVLGACWEQVP